MNSDSVILCIANKAYIAKDDVIKWYSHHLGTNIFLNNYNHQDILPLASSKKDGLLTSDTEISLIYYKYSLLFVVDLKDTTGCVSLRLNMSIREKILETLKKYIKYLGNELKLPNNCLRNSPTVNVTIILFRPHSTYKDYAVLLANFYIKDSSNYFYLSLVLEEKLTEYWSAQQHVNIDKETKMQKNANKDLLKCLITQCIKFSCNLPSNTHKRIILLTDGMCDFENSDAKDTQELHEKFKCVGITFSLVFVTSCLLTPAGQTILKMQDYETLPIGFIPYIPPYYYAINCFYSGYSHFINPYSDEKEDELEAAFQKLAFWHKISPAAILNLASNEDMAIPNDAYYFTNQFPLLAQRSNGTLICGRDRHKTYRQDLLCASYISSTALNKLIHICFGNGFSLLAVKNNEKRRLFCIKLSKTIGYETFLLAKMNIISNEVQEFNFKISVVSSEKNFLNLENSFFKCKHYKAGPIECGKKCKLAMERYQIQMFMEKFENILEILNHFDDATYFNKYFDDKSFHEGENSQFFKAIFQDKESLFTLDNNSYHSCDKPRYRLNEEKLHLYSSPCAKQMEKCANIFEMSDFIKYWRPLLPMLNDLHDENIRSIAAIRSFYLILKVNIKKGGRNGLDSTFNFGLEKRKYQMVDLYEKLKAWCSLVLIRNKVYIKRGINGNSIEKEESICPLFFFLTIDTQFLPVVHIKIHTFPPYADVDAIEKEVEAIKNMLHSITPGEEFPYYLIKSHNFTNIFLNYGKNVSVANVMNLRKFPMSHREHLNEMKGDDVLENITPSFPREYLHYERSLIPILMHDTGQGGRIALDLFDTIRNCLIQQKLLCGFELASFKESAHPVIMIKEVQIRQGREEETCCENTLLIQYVIFPPLILMSLPCGHNQNPRPSDQFLYVMCDIYVEPLYGRTLDSTWQTIDNCTYQQLPAKIFQLDARLINLLSVHYRLIQNQCPRPLKDDLKSPTTSGSNSSLKQQLHPNPKFTSQNIELLSRKLKILTGKAYSGNASVDEEFGVENVSLTYDFKAFLEAQNPLYRIDESVYHLPHIKDFLNQLISLAQEVMLIYSLFSPTPCQPTKSLDKGEEDKNEILVDNIVSYFKQTHRRIDANNCGAGDLYFTQTLASHQSLVIVKVNTLQRGKKGDKFVMTCYATSKPHLMVSAVGIDHSLSPAPKFCDFSFQKNANGSTSFQHAEFSRDPLPVINSLSPALQDYILAFYVRYQRTYLKTLYYSLLNSIPVEKGDVEHCIDFMCHEKTMELDVTDYMRECCHKIPTHLKQGHNNNAVIRHFDKHRGLDTAINSFMDSCYFTIPSHPDYRYCRKYSTHPDFQHKTILFQNEAEVALATASHVDVSGIKPFFLHLAATSKCRNGIKTFSLLKIPTCLRDFGITQWTSDLKLTLDVICLYPSFEDKYHPKSILNYNMPGHSTEHYDDTSAERSSNSGFEMSEDSTLVSHKDSPHSSQDSEISEFFSRSDLSYSGGLRSSKPTRVGKAFKNLRGIMLKLKWFYLDASLTSYNNLLVYQYPDLLATPNFETLCHTVCGRVRDNESTRSLESPSSDSSESSNISGEMWMGNNFQREIPLIFVFGYGKSIQYFINSFHSTLSQQNVELEDNREATLKFMPINELSNLTLPLKFDQSSLRPDSTGLSGAILNRLEPSLDERSKCFVLMQLILKGAGDKQHLRMGSKSKSYRDISKLKRTDLKPKSWSQSQGDVGRIGIENDEKSFAEVSEIRIPPFWMIAMIGVEKCSIYFHASNSYDISEERLLKQKSVCEGIIKRTKLMVDDINRKMLLDDLYKTRYCDSLLIPDKIEENVGDSDGEEGDDMLKPLTRETFGVSLSRLNKVDHSFSYPATSFYYHNKNQGSEKPYLAASMYFKPGRFACPCVWRTYIPLHPRLKSGAQFNMALQILDSSILERFEIVNRPRHYVYRDSHLNVYYFTLQAMTSSHSTEQQQSMMPILRSKFRYKNYEEYLVINFHGISRPSEEIKRDLVQVFENKLDDAIIDFITIALVRNPKTKLAPADKNFLLASPDKSNQELNLVIPPIFLEYSGLTTSLLFYWSQHLLNSTIIPNLTEYFLHDMCDDDSLDLYRGKVWWNNLFLYTKFGDPGKKGLACIHVKLHPPVVLEYTTKMNSEINLAEPFEILKNECSDQCTKISVNICERLDSGLSDDVANIFSSAFQIALRETVLEAVLLTKPLTRSLDGEREKMNPLFLWPLLRYIEHVADMTASSTSPVERGSVRSYSYQLPNYDMAPSYVRDFIKHMQTAAKTPYQENQLVIGLNPDDSCSMAFYVEENVDNYPPFIIIDPKECQNQSLSDEEKKYGRMCGKGMSSYVIVCLEKNATVLEYDDRGFAFSRLKHQIKSKGLMGQYGSSYNAFKQHSDIFKAFAEDYKQIPIDPHNFFIARSWFMLATLSGNTFKMHCYNWTMPQTASLDKFMSQLTLLYHKKYQLLKSIILQKAGLFQPAYLQLSQDPSKESLDLWKVLRDAFFLIHSSPHPFNKFVKSAKFAEISALYKTTSPLSNDNIPFHSLSLAVKQKLFAQNPYALVSSILMNQTFRPSERVAQSGPRSVEEDFLKMLGIPFLAVLQRRLEGVREKVIIRYLYDTWISSGCRNVKTNFDQIRTPSQSLPLSALSVLKKWSRPFHYCATPVLFDSEWRKETAKTRSSYYTPTPKNEEGKLGLVDSVGSEYDWIPLYKSMMREYIFYLQNLGFSHVSAVQNQATYDESNPSANSGNNLPRAFMQKTTLGGILLLEISLSSPFIILSFHVCESLRIVHIDFSSPAHQKEQTTAFLNMCERYKILCHLHSFSYDFHLRTTYQYLAGSSTTLLPKAYNLIPMLTDFLNYYNKAPGFSQNLIIQKTLDVSTEVQESMLNFLLTQHPLPGFRAYQSHGHKERFGTIGGDTSFTPHLVSVLSQNEERGDNNEAPSGCTLLSRSSPLLMYNKHVDMVVILFERCSPTTQSDTSTSRSSDLTRERVKNKSFFSSTEPHPINGGIEGDIYVEKMKFYFLDRFSVYLMLINKDTHFPKASLESRIGSFKKVVTKTDSKVIKKELTSSLAAKPLKEPALGENGKGGDLIDAKRKMRRASGKEDVHKEGLIRTSVKIRRVKSDIMEESKRMYNYQISTKHGKRSQIISVVKEGSSNNYSGDAHALRAAKHSLEQQYPPLLENKNDEIINILTSTSGKATGPNFIEAESVDYLGYYSKSEEQIQVFLNRESIQILDLLKDSLNGAAKNWRLTQLWDTYFTQSHHAGNSTSPIMAPPSSPWSGSKLKSASPSPSFLFDPKHKKKLSPSPLNVSSTGKIWQNMRNDVDFEELLASITTMEITEMMGDQEFASLFSSSLNNSSGSGNNSFENLHTRCIALHPHLIRSFNTGSHRYMVILNPIYKYHSIMVTYKGDEGKMGVYSAFKDSHLNFDLENAQHVAAHITKFLTFLSIPILENCLNL